jgi:hypothetical protein
MPTLRSTAATVVIAAGLMAISPAANACVLLGCLVERITKRQAQSVPPSTDQARLATASAARRAAAAAAEKAKVVRRDTLRDTGRAAPARVAAPRPAAEPGARASAEAQAARREREADIRAAITHHARAGVADMTEQEAGTDGARRVGGLAAPERLRRLGGAPPPIVLPAEAEAAAPSPAPSAAAFLPPDAAVAESAGEEPAAGRMPADVLAAAETAGLWTTATEPSSAAGQMVADASAQTTPSFRDQADGAPVVAASAATGAWDFPVLALIFPAFGGALSAVVLATALRRILGLSGKTHADGDEDAPVTVPERI